MHSMCKIAGTVRVRLGKSGEQVTLLNEQVIALDIDSLCIADDQQILALAGVMGDSASAVNGQTCDIFLECAFFNPLSIAGKARKYGLHTDSSHRFERGVRPLFANSGNATRHPLILEISGGNVGTMTDITHPAHLPIRLGFISAANN